MKFHKRTLRLIKRNLLVIAVILLLAMTVLGLLISIGFGLTFAELLPNLITELIGILITVLIIDQIYHGREESEEKKRLLREVKSRDNADALKALEAIRDKGWLDGQLLTNTKFRGTDLSTAELMSVNFGGSDFINTKFENCLLVTAEFPSCTFLSTSFEKSNLSGSNFEHARFFPDHDSTLSKALSMRHVTMPNGKKYDGRYLLQGDELDIIGKMRDDISDVTYLELYKERKEVVKKYFGISDQEFENGTRWAVSNLDISNKALKNILNVVTKIKT